MGTAAQSPDTAAERPPAPAARFGAFPHRLGRVTLAPAGADPIRMFLGRTVVAMTADEADSLAMALARAASDSRRVLP